ncbi:MAG: heavy metal-binding domain-containing protein [Gemmataceae bacterium]|nr:heavy metal-binding domain-containing protein [Gemmataceae bacterium]
MLITGLSGNEIWCLAKKDIAPGGVVVGNSVYSQGLIRGLTTGLKTMAGGELTDITQLITEGRHSALSRMEVEAKEQGADGLTGVVTEIKRINSLIEFLAVGSAIKRSGSNSNGGFFSSACSGQDLYCQIDAGYQPVHFVMGNIAYALGIGGGIWAAIKTMSGGEVDSISGMINNTRHKALERLEDEAKKAGANCIVDIKTSILPFGAGVKEMVLVGTASHNPHLGNPERPYTSELTGEELWNLTDLGYQPLRLLMASSVFALGIGGGIKTFFSSFSRGEVDSMTKLIYQARENCINRIRNEANEIGAAGVLDLKLFMHEMLGGMIEILAIGTAFKKNSDVANASPVLPPQAIIRDRSTFFSSDLDQPSMAQTLKGGTLEK